MYGKIKYTIRKYVEWATFWYINQDHSMNVCKDVVKNIIIIIIIKKGKVMASSTKVGVIISKQSYGQCEFINLCERPPIRSLHLICET